MAKTKLALISAFVSSMCVCNAAFAANPYIMVSGYGLRYLSMSSTRVSYC